MTPLALGEPRSGPRVEVKVCSKVAVMKSSKFEVARESLETVPSRSPGVGAPPLGRDGPAPPLSRAAGALAQFCRQTGRAKNWRGSGTGGTPGRIRTDHIVRHRGGEPPRAHRRAGRRGTRPRRQRGESSSRPAVTWQLEGGIRGVSSYARSYPRAMYVCRKVKNSQARTGHRRGMGGRYTLDRC